MSKLSVTLIKMFQKFPICAVMLLAFVLRLSYMYMYNTPSGEGGYRRGELKQETQYAPGWIRTPSCWGLVEGAIAVLLKSLISKWTASLKARSLAEDVAEHHRANLTQNASLAGRHRYNRHNVRQQVRKVRQCSVGSYIYMY